MTVAFVIADQNYAGIVILVGKTSVSRAGQPLDSTAPAVASASLTLCDAAPHSFDLPDVQDSSGPVLTLLDDERVPLVY